MTVPAGWNSVEADVATYPEVAIQAVRSVHHQTPAPVYGYFREGLQQKVCLFQVLPNAQAWFVALQQEQPGPDYAAIFLASDLTRPVPGFESFGQTVENVVGQLGPLLLGLPLGALGGYFLRKWQEGHPGQWVPGLPTNEMHTMASPPAKTAGDYEIGGPWLDIEPVVGVQIEDQERRRTWPQTKALIQSAVKEVTDIDRAMSTPAEAYVWSLEPATSSSMPGLVLESITYIEAFPSVVEALEYMRQRIQTPHVALALFDRRSRHWPNPTNWTKSNDETHADAIEQQVAKYRPVRAFDRVGYSIGTAFDNVRNRARAIAEKRAGNVIGVIHTPKDGTWRAFAFERVDDADDWFGASTQDPESFTYAAYYDKTDYMWPYPINEKIGKGGSLARPKRLVHRLPTALLEESKAV